MVNLKNQKGSITFFVLSSCLFLIASITGVFMYIQSKQIAVDREYRQIKSFYERNEEDTINTKINIQNIPNNEKKNDIEWK